MAYQKNNYTPMVDATSAYKNILVLGLGDVGAPIVNELLAQKPAFNVFLSTRRDPADPAFADYKARGANIIHIDPKNRQDLVEKFKQIDVIVSTVGGQGIPDQVIYIDAAIEAGVKRFCPSEFGANTQLEVTKKSVIVKKSKISDYVIEMGKEGKITYTLFETGSWPDWGIPNGFLGFNMAERSAIVYGDGNRRTPMTTLPSVARYVVAALRNPKVSENKLLRLADVQVTQNELIAELEKAAGTKWSTTNMSFEDLQTLTREAYAQGDDANGFVYELRDLIWSGNVDHESLETELFPEVKRRLLSEIIQEIVAK